MPFMLFTFFFYLYSLNSGACYTTMEHYSCPENQIMFNITHCKTYKEVIVRKVYSETRIVVSSIILEELFVPSKKSEIIDSVHSMFLSFIIYLTIAGCYYFFTIAPNRGECDYYPLIFILIPIISALISILIFPYCKV